MNNTGWNDKIVALKNTTWIHFRLMKTGFLFSFFFFFFFCYRPSTSWPVEYKSQERQEPSIMSESDTMFNERDRRCATVQLMLSTDPSYDNRTIASTLKMQIWIATNNRDVPRVMKTKFPATVMVFGVVSSEGHIMPHHIFEVGSKDNTNVLKSVVIPWCNQVAGGRPRVWQQDSAPAHKSKDTQAWLQKECYDFVPFSHCPLLPWPEPAGIPRMVIRREHHQHDFPQHQSQPDRRHFPSIHRAPTGACGKACSQLRIRIEAVIEAKGGYIE